MESNTVDDDLPATQILDDRILKDVVAYVEVRSEHENRSSCFARELERLGATVVEKFTNDVTHVVFKEGSKRTQVKAQKKGVHLVSVLWVDECKQHQKHAPENWFPATLPSSPLIIGKLKKAKSMQPLDFEEHYARVSKRMDRKKKRLLKEMDRLRESGQTPTFSPQGRIIVRDTQPRSPDGGFILTPVRLTIPDTPPSMREKWKQLQQAKQGARESYTSMDDDGDLEKEAHFKAMEPLQKTLFKSPVGNSDSTATMSADDSSVFLSDDDVRTCSQSSRNGSAVSDASVNEDIHSLVTSINTTLHKGKGTRAFLATESDDSLVHSQGHSSDAGHDAESLFRPLFFSTAEPGKSADCSTAEPGKSADYDQTEADARKSRSRVGKMFKNRKSRHSRLLSIQEFSAKTYDDSVKENGSKTEDFLDLITDDQEKNKAVSDRADISHSALSKTVGSKDSESGSNLSAMNDSRKSKDSQCIRKKRVSRTSQVENKLTPVVNMDAMEDRQCLTASCEQETSSLSENFPTSESINLSEQLTTTDNMASESKVTGSKVSMENTEKTSTHVKRRTRSHAVGESIHLSTGEEKEIGKRNRRTTVSENLVDGTSGRGAEKTKPKKMKKKLLSFSDLNDRHSILPEPTKATQVERPELLDSVVKPKTNKKDKSRNNIEVESCLLNQETSVMLNGESELPKRQRNGKRKLEVNNEAPETKRARRSPTGISKENVRNKILVNDTPVKDSVVPATSSRSTSKLAESNSLQDLTTQLNLTKDATVPSLSRDATLSTSMSRVYTDTNSFLNPPRRSIDEFSLAMRNPMKRSMLKSSLLTLSEETTGDQLLVTDSETSLSSTSTMGKQRKGKRPSIVMTSLHSCEQDVVISVVKKLGGFVIAEAVNETTTHVVCGESRRTLNVLQCLARGIWLLSKEWVLKSLEADSWIPEEEYECHSLFPTCKVARLEREKCVGLYRQTMFTTVGLVYVSGRSSPPRPNLVQLVKLCGGKVTGSLEKASIYIGSDFHPGLVCVKTSWLLDCITSHSLLPTSAYSLDQPKRESSPVY